MDTMERSPRSVRCDVHGLRYDPAVSAGCSRCRDAVPPPAAKPATPSPFAHPALLPGIVVIIVTIAMSTQFLGPRRVEPPPGAYVDAENAFAIEIPSGWRATKASAVPMDPQLRSLAPAGMNNIAVVIAPENPKPPIPSLNVAIIPYALPAIEESAKDELARMLSSAYQRVLQNYSNRSEIVEVNGIRALRVLGTGVIVQPRDPEPVYVDDPNVVGGRRVVRFNYPQARHVTLHLDQYIVPGRERAYVLTTTATAETVADTQGFFRDLVEGFHVLERPRRARSILLSSLMGALAGAVLYVVVFLVGKMLRRN